MRQDSSRSGDSRTTPVARPLITAWRLRLMAGILTLVCLLGLGGCIGIPPSVVAIEENSRQPEGSAAQKDLAPVGAFAFPEDRYRNE